VAQAHGAYTYDVYTALQHRPKGVGFSLGARQALGLVDGIASADTGFMGAQAEATSKALREERFPPALLDKGMRARVQDGQASVAADKVHILNCIIGGRELDAEVLLDHARYEEINATLHGRVATDALKPAIVTGGAMLERALEALAVAHVTRLGVSLGVTKEATVEVMTRVVAALPLSLEHLSLRGCEQLVDAPRLSALTRLRTLDLFGCTKLASLPELAALTHLHSLNVSYNSQLTSLPELAALTHLQSLIVKECSKLASLPELAALTHLQALGVGGCMRLTSLPELSGLLQLQSLDISNCKKLASLPELEALEQRGVKVKR
jgi:hypothetical protein